MHKFIHLVFALIVLLSSCSRIEEPQFRALENFRVKNLELDGVIIRIGIRYYNPNNFTLTVKETGFDIFLDEVFLGRFTQEQDVDIKSNADFVLLLTGSIPMVTFLQLDMKNIHQKEVALRAEGTTRVGKGGVYITRKLGYAGRHRLDKIKF